jgi:hypothetical protein
MSEVIESTVNAEPVENVEPQAEQVETTNNASEEVVTPQVEEKPVQSKEDNARFAEMRRKAESEAKDKLISEMYGESHNIHTYADYQKAVQAEQERQRLEELKQNNIPEDLAKEIIENKKFREQYEAEKLTRSQQEARQKDYESFLNTFPDVKADEIPTNVWEEVEKGKSLVDAYAKYENSLLKAKIAEYEKGSKTLEANNKNAENTTGSVIGNGSAKEQIFTKEEVDKMSLNDVKKNYNRILESSKHWK